MNILCKMLIHDWKVVGKIVYDDTPILGNPIKKEFETKQCTRCKEWIVVTPNSIKSS